MVFIATCTLRDCNKGTGCGLHMFWIINYISELAILKPHVEVKTCTQSRMYFHYTVMTYLCGSEDGLVETFLWEILCYRNDI